MVDVHSVPNPVVRRLEVAGPTDTDDDLVDTMEGARADAVEMRLARRAPCGAMHRAAKQSGQLPICAGYLAQSNKLGYLEMRGDREIVSFCTLYKSDKLLV